MMTNHPIYFDYCSTTPTDPRVLEAMLPFFSEKFGNSVSSLHAFGWEAEQAAEQARAQVAQVLGCLPFEIYFTSGATESNNWTLQGLTSRLQKENPGEKIHIISSKVEHTSVLKTLEHLKSCGHIEYDLAEVDKNGHVQSEQIAKLITHRTKLISIMWINNEIGSINPIHEIGKIARENQIYFHTDATQAVGKLPINLETLPIDMMSFSGHKIYGPKGVGVLFLRSKHPKVHIDPLLFGGGHEKSLRAGTLNIPGIVGLGIAMKIIGNEFQSEVKKLQDLKEKYLKLWKESGIQFKINGGEAPHILSLTLKYNSPGPIQLPGIAFSRGSACLSGASVTGSISHVLSALQLDQIEANHTVRISFGRFTTEEDFEKLTNVLSKI